MKRLELSIDTTGRRLVDITNEISRILDGTGGEGLVSVFIPHATAGVAIFETGAGSEQDLMDALERIFPRDDRYWHSHGSRGHGADHIIPAFIAPTITVPASKGKLELGVWQSVVLVDTNVDNPIRHVRVSFLEG